MGHATPRTTSVLPEEPAAGSPAAGSPVTGAAVGGPSADTGGGARRAVHEDAPVDVDAQQHRAAAHPGTRDPGSTAPVGAPAASDAETRVALPDGDEARVALPDDGGAGVALADDGDLGPDDDLRDDDDTTDDFDGDPEDGDPEDGDPEDGDPEDGDDAPPVRRVADRGLPAPRQVVQLVGAAGVAAVVVTAVALLYGDGVGRSIDPGLPNPGAVTAWGLPLARLVALLAAALVVGNLLAAVFWTPARSAVADFHRTVAARAATVWAVAAVAIWLFTLSDIRGLPVGGILNASALDSLGLRTSAGQAGLVTVVAAGAAAALSRRYPAGALLAGLLGVLPPAFVESAVSTADHRAAIAAAALQVLAVTVWTGALAALLLGAARAGAPGGPPTAAVLLTARRYGRAAVTAAVVTAGAVILSAWVVLGPTDTGLDSTYGRLVAALLVALGAAAALGRWRSRQTVPALGRGRVDPFVRFAAIELAVLGAITGLSVALARTPSPLESGIGIHHESPGKQMLGYDLPPVISFTQLATDWRPDVLLLVLCAALVGGYFWLEGRAHRAAVTWPVGRTAAWLGGVAAIAVASSSGVGRYAPAFFSITIVQHLMLAVVAPLLLTRGAPLTLALRAVRRAPAGDQPEREAVPGPRDWLLAALRSRPARLLTAPGVVVALWVAGPAGTYFTGVFEATRWSYAADLTVQLYLLTTGYLLFWWLTGRDPRPAGRRTDSTRTRMACAAAVCAVAIGLLVANVSDVVAADWWIGLLRVLRLPWPWGSRTAADDQAVGGTLFAATSAVVFLVIAADRLAAGLGRRRRAR